MSVRETAVLRNSYAHDRADGYPSAPSQNSNVFPPDEPAPVVWELAASDHRSKRTYRKDSSQGSSASGWLLPTVSSLRFLNPMRSGRIGARRSGDGQRSGEYVRP